MLLSAQESERERESRERGGGGDCSRVWDDEAKKPRASERVCGVFGNRGAAAAEGIPLFLFFPACVMYDTVAAAPNNTQTQTAKSRASGRSRLKEVCFDSVRPSISKRGSSSLPRTFSPLPSERGGQRQNGGEGEGYGDV